MIGLEKKRKWVNLTMLFNVYSLNFNQLASLSDSRSLPNCSEWITQPWPTINPRCLTCLLRVLQAYFVLPSQAQVKVDWFVTQLPIGSLSLTREELGLGRSRVRGFVLCLFHALVHFRVLLLGNGDHPEPPGGAVVRQHAVVVYRAGVVGRGTWNS